MRGLVFVYIIEYKLLTHLCRIHIAYFRAIHNLGATTPNKVMNVKGKHVSHRAGGSLNK